MNRIGLFLLFALGPSISQAAMLVCMALPYNNNGTSSRGGQHVDKVVAHCKDFKSGRYAKVEMNGLGPSWRLSIVDVFAVACPGVDYEKLGGTYKGLRLEADAIVGVRLGMYTPDMKQACFVPGIKILSIGGSATKGDMTITVVGGQPPAPAPTPAPTPQPTPAPTPAPTATPVPTPTPPPPTIR